MGWPLISGSVINMGGHVGSGTECGFTISLEEIGEKREQQRKGKKR